jgi:hypothetical protein
MPEERDDREDEALRALSREEPPPPELEERVVAALRETGVIGRRGRRSTAGWLRLAAALACVGLGWLARGALPAAPPASPPTPAPESSAQGSLYLLLLSPLAKDADPEIEAALVQEYGSWARRLHGEGRLVSAEKLGRGVRWVPAAAAQSAANVSGFFVIRAANLDEAEAIARACPHIRHGGRVLVRDIDPT